jgi:hypothetical protein
MVIGFHSQTVVRILEELGEIAEHARRDPQRKEMTVGILIAPFPSCWDVSARIRRH